MASCTRMVQLAQIASALLLLVFAVTTLVLSDDAGDAAKQYQQTGDQDGAAATKAPVLPLARCHKNSTGCCDFSSSWDTDYTFCDSSCAVALRDKAEFTDKCVSEVVVIGDGLKSASLTTGWCVLLSSGVIAVAVLLANLSPRYAKWKAGPLCCVNCLALIPMFVGTVAVILAALLVSTANKTAHDACPFICVGHNGQPLAKTEDNSLVCAVVALAKGHDCSSGSGTGSCCFQSDLTALEKLNASTAAPLGMAVASAVLATLMGCCSTFTCLHGKAQSSIDDPLVVQGTSSKRVNSV